MIRIGRLLKVIDNVNEWAGILVSYLALGMIAIVSFEVMARYVFNHPTLWGQDISVFLFGPYFVLGGGYMSLHGSHVACDALYSKLSVKGKAIFDICTAGIVFAFIGSLFFYGIDMALESVTRWEVYESAWAPPFWPVKLTVPIGAFLLLIQWIAKFARDVMTLIHPDSVSTQYQPAVKV